MTRHCPLLKGRKGSVKKILTPFLGGNEMSARDIPKLEKWPTFSCEGEYYHVVLIKKIDILQENFHISDEMIVGKLHSLFTRTEKKWYYKIRQEYGKHDWIWWKSEIITKWSNNSWRFKIQNAFECATFNTDKDKPLTWFFKQRDRSSSLHPDILDSMINMKILEIEHDIKGRCVEAC
ncbi:hypothetical protein O181_057138 [Austropuccinia psidii MF-1]|uniref:Uncharacterized protein n=1 Tax=Austropuccinia psidii MF-1 TaxID=1389203 RepID=A0A9Q3EEF3_9BASI|nr:hypothetical protein [Austropuccinia psidii MF-1]